MVSLEDVQASNSRITSTLPAGLVAIFVGGTSGIGETSLKQFVKHARKPRVYFIGRSQDAADRIAAECGMLNAEAELVFIKADTSLIRTVDEVCEGIKMKEQAVNLLFLTTGTARFFTKTSEDLHYAVAVAHYSRIRFIVNLLPLLREATHLRRVVSVLSGTREGPIHTDDFQALNMSVISLRAHLTSVHTLCLEAIAAKAPDVSFVHDYPGSVKSSILKEGTGLMIWVLSIVMSVVGPLIFIPNEVSGERHLFLATSARYPAGKTSAASPGVSLADGVLVAEGTSGQIGSGVYSVGSDGESAGVKVEELLAKMRKEGMVEKVWDHAEVEFLRISAVDWKGHISSRRPQVLS